MVQIEENPDELALVAASSSPYALICTKAESAYYGARIYPIIGKRRTQSEEKLVRETTLNLTSRTAAATYGLPKPSFT